jgi:hypothetical protein
MVRAAGRDLVRAGGELGLNPCGLHCTLAACAVRLQLALHARAARSWLARARSFYFALQKIYEFIQKYI